MKTVRCAIYTRKSSDEGLEQDFNSLDAQREACAAYVLSQASEGWELLPDHYDDGGISGGTLERPALKQLLADIAASKIDIVVLYKIDRLTRSLLDFAKLVEAFEKARTSFVSVTQSFNTTTSMGRLTLNMLLSFAQFEREVTAERIRDKLAASKAKGMWMGGIPPLGYQPDGRSLKIVKPHAELIRDIYARYRRLGSVRLLSSQLNAEGIVVPSRKLASDRTIGGGAFSRGQLYSILKNPIYVGRIAHRDKTYPGNHAPIIAPDQWAAVQRQLGLNLDGGRARKRATVSPLAGIIYDGAGDPMLAAHTTKASRRYRYYVSKSLHLGEANGSQGRRIAAPEIEAAVACELARLLDDPLALVERMRWTVEPASVMPLVTACGNLAMQLRETGLAGLQHLLSRVQLHEKRLDLSISTAAMSEQLAMPLGIRALPSVTVSSELALARTGQVVRFVHANGQALTGDKADPALVALIHRGRKWWNVLRQGRIGPSELARQEGVNAPYLSRVARLAFLAPAVVEAILAGKLRAGIGSTILLRHDAIPPDWDDQVSLFVAA